MIETFLDIFFFFLSCFLESAPLKLSLTAVSLRLVYSLAGMSMSKTCYEIVLISHFYCRSSVARFGGLHELRLVSW